MRITERAERSAGILPPSRAGGFQVTVVLSASSTIRNPQFPAILLDIPQTPGMAPSTLPKLATFNHELFARSYVRTDNASCAYRHARVR